MVDQTSQLSPFLKKEGGPLLSTPRVSTSDNFRIFGPNWAYIEKVFTYASTLRATCRVGDILKFVFDSLGHPVSRAEWFDYLESELHSDALCMHLIEHTARRYMRYWFTPQAKVDLFRCHYGMFHERFSPAMMERMRDYPGLLLGELTGKSGRRYHITLHHSMTKEGEIAFCFIDTEFAAQLVTFRGTFGRDAGGRKVFWVGAIQGPRPPLGRGVIAHATKDLSVLRPKQATLHAAFAFLTWVGVDTIFLPPRAHHISYRRWRNLFAGNKISSDYDAFWEEYTTQKAPWGDYVLSLPVPRRKLEDVQPKRRKDWLRRQSYLDALAKSINEVLESLRRA
jgi:uncharacterized protein